MTDLAADDVPSPHRLGPTPANERHQWAALFITTLGMLMATIDASIVLIALPAVFRGIHLDPLLPSNTFFLLWMILGFLIVTSVLVVSLGRLGDSTAGSGSTTSASPSSPSSPCCSASPG